MPAADPLSCRAVAGREIESLETEAGSLPFDESHFFGAEAPHAIKGEVELALDGVALGMRGHVAPCHSIVNLIPSRAGLESRLDGAAGCF